MANDPHNIDFERVAMLLNVVQKQASVAPQYMAISAIAMSEIKEMNEEAQAHLNQLAKDRQEAEQEAAIELERQRLADEPKPKVYVPPAETDEPVARRV